MCASSAATTGPKAASGRFAARRPAPTIACLAAQVKRPDANSITVEIGLPDDEEANRNSFCNIGRLAEVRFQRSPFAFLASVSRVFNRLVGNERPKKDRRQVASHEQVVASRGMDN